MKASSLLLTLPGLICLIWSNTGWALGDSEAQMSTPAQVIASPGNPSSSDEGGPPWFTGPLFAAGGDTVPANQVNIESYFFYTKAYGAYDSNRKASGLDNFYTFSPTLVFTVGATDFMDITATIPYVYNRTDGQTNSDIGDATLTLGFQLLKNVADTWRPSIRATVGETFPTGNYQNLNPTQNGTDATGLGAYQTSFGLNFQHLWQLKSGKYFSDRLSLGYTLPATTDVQGVNTFGGIKQTTGKEKLGNQFSADLGLEYTLTNHWVPALDILYTVSGNSSFNGVTGTDVNGLPAIANGPSGDTLSLAPAIEYNFNSHLGIIAGPWFSIAGRNSTQFVSGVVAINYAQ